MFTTQITKNFAILLVIFSLYCNGIKEEKHKIRLGIPPRSSFMPVFLAAEKGIFKKNGLDIEIVLDEKVRELYSEKKIDIICTGLTEPILFSSEGHGTQIIYRFSYSLTNDIIVSGPNIKDLNALRNKKISFDGVNSSSHIFVQQLLSKKGIKEGEYYAVNLPVDQVIEQLSKGNIDAGHITGVSLSEIKKRGFNIIGQSSDDPDLLSDTLSADSDFIKKNPTEVVKLLASILEANDMYAANPSDTITTLANKMGKSREEIEEDLKGMRFLSLKENIQALRIANSEVLSSTPQGTSFDGNGSNIPKLNPMGEPGTPKIIEPIQSNNYTPVSDRSGLFTAGETIVQFLRQHGQLYQMPNLRFIINDSFVKKLEEK